MLKKHNKAGNTDATYEDLFASMKEQIGKDVKDLPKRTNRRGFVRTVLTGSAALGAGLAAAFLMPQHAMGDCEESCVIAGKCCLYCMICQTPCYTSCQTPCDVSGNT